MAEVVLKIENLDKAIDAFRKMPESFSGTMRLTMKRAIRDIREHVRGNHRFKSRTGTLERAIQSDTFEDPIGGVVFLNLGMAPYGFYVHEGTYPHAIFPKRKKALRWARSGDFVFAKAVLHPGTKSDRFMEDAWYRYKPEIPERFAKAVDRAIKEAGV